MAVAACIYFVFFFVCQRCVLFAILVRQSGQSSIQISLKSIQTQTTIKYWIICFKCFSYSIWSLNTIQFIFLRPSYRTVFIYVMWNEVSWVVFIFCALLRKTKSTQNEVTSNTVQHSIENHMQGTTTQFIRIGIRSNKKKLVYLSMRSSSYCLAQTEDCVLVREQQYGAKTFIFRRTKALLVE